MDKLTRTYRRRLALLGCVAADMALLAGLALGGLFH